MDVDQAINSFGLGVWFGLSAPLLIHVAIVFIGRDSATTLSRVIRFVAVPLTLVGLLGIAGVFGQSRDTANFSALGMFLGIAVYGLCAWLNQKRIKAAPTSVPITDRDWWERQWEIERSRGYKRFLVRGLLINGAMPGFAAALILFFVQPRLGEVNLGAFASLLVVWFLFSLAGLIYSWWWWRVAEKRFSAPSKQHGT